MATHSSVLAWEIPLTEEPGGLQSMGSQRDMTEQLNNDNKGFRTSQGASQGAAVVKEPACQCRRHKRCGFDPWVRKIPWRKK